MKLLKSMICLLLPLAALGQNTNVIATQSHETGLLLRDDVTRMFIHQSSGDRAYDYVKQIAMWDRNVEDYIKAAEWVKSKAEAFGLSEVVLETFPAEDFEPPIIKKAELWVTAPYQFRMTSYDDLPMSIAGNSGAVDTTAELVYVGGGNADADYEGKDVKGKIVLATQDPSSVGRVAISKGAIGVVSCYVVPYWDATNRLPGDFPDQVGWAAIYVANHPEAFAFMISERKFRDLKSILDRKQKVMMRALVVHAGKLEAYQIVSGVIRGSRFPDEEIVVTAHLDHYKPGANDNASGSASSLEIVRTLNELIASKQIPPPLRTIRFLWLPEFSGTMAWFKTHANEPKKRILNLNFDMLGANTVEVNSQFAINYTPGWNGHFINALSASVLDFMNKYNGTRYPRRKDYNIISVNGSRNPVTASMQSYSRGSDHQVFNDYGIAGVGFLTWPDNNYHSSEDTPAHVDPTQLHRVVFGGLALMGTVAYATEQNTDAILGQVFSYGQKRIAEDEKKALDIISSSTSEDLAVNAYLAKAVMRDAFSRERHALQTCQALCNVSIEKSVQRYVLQFNQLEAAVQKTLVTLVAYRAADLKTAVPKAAGIETGEERFSGIIPERIKGKELVTYFEARGQLPKDHKVKLTELEAEIKTALNELREQETDELRIYDFQNAVASYADGRRSVIEIRDAVYAEYGALFTLSTIENLFRVFEGAGAMRFKVK